MNRYSVAAILSSAIYLAYFAMDEPPVDLIGILISLANLYDMVAIPWNKPETLRCAGYALLLWSSSVAHIALLQLLFHSIGHLFRIIVVVTISDTLQYFVGTTLGTHRLGPPWPSPNKTIEGYLSTVIAFIFGVLLFPELPPILILRWIAWGCVGDLWVSWCKRLMDIKDTSNLLGQHGGWLDRVDGIYTACLAQLWFYL